ncbi:MAG: phage shock protein PspC (stress-responsive transcriptional regulator) [Arcticibacterium sp.]|jgi:phage shock protein PspC (stress-responsive transcriptional regulator)
MNKTLTINLANSIFNIDENAYNALQRYLEAVKKYLTGTKGNEEILADVEARIAELFTEKMTTDKQVIILSDVEAIIQVMGQPEDYSIDEDIFDEHYKQPKTKTQVKKLYRDPESKLLGGVCSGIGHYLSIDPIWVRLLFIIFLFGGGFSVITYIILWIIVPEANTTAQKLDMQGEAANLSNIEKKIKEGFENVTEKVKNADYDGFKNDVNKSSNSVIKGIGDFISLIFSTVGKIISTLFNVLGKFMGVLFILVGSLTLLGLFFGLFTVGILDISMLPGVQFFPLINASELPIWVLSLLVFFAIGIPFYSLLYVGLTVITTNLKKMGNISKISLLGIWLLSLGTLIFFGIKQANSYSIRGNQMEKIILIQNKTIDTLYLKANESEHFEYSKNDYFDGISISYDTNGKEVLYSKQVSLNIKNAYEEVISLKKYKSANGYSYIEAKERANAIEYRFDYSGNHLEFNNYFISATNHKIRDQKIDMTLLVPTGTIIVLDPSMRELLGWDTKNDQDMYRKDLPDQLWEMTDSGTLKCLDCLSSPI